MRRYDSGSLLAVGKRLDFPEEKMRKKKYRSATDKNEAENPASLCAEISFLKSQDIRKDYYISYLLTHQQFVNFPVSLVGE